MTFLKLPGKKILIMFIIISFFITALNAQNKPNIVFIMADDVGAEVLQSYGGESYATPHLNKLAESGLQFNYAFTTPLCTPTRVQVMSGQYPFRNGWTGGIWEQPADKQYMSPKIFNFAQMLKKAGYSTAVAGKWQLARFDIRPEHPKNIGFDEHCLWTWQYRNQLPEEVDLESEGKPARFWSPGIWRNGEIMEDVAGKYGPDIYTDFLLDFMERHQSEQFFVYFPMTLAHFPFVHTPGTAAGVSKQENFTKMVPYMDMLVGRIVQKLESLGLRENTLLIFTGDNGTDRNQSSQWKGEKVPGGKGNMTDAGTRVPLIVSWPGTAPANQQVDNLVDLSDMLPTFAEAAGANIPSSHVVDGRSILARLKGEGGQKRDWIFCQLGDQWFFRTHRYRLHQDGTFYRMKDFYDPEEMIKANDKEIQVKSMLDKAAVKLGLKEE